MKLVEEVGLLLDKIDGGDRAVLEAQFVRFVVGEVSVFLGLRRNEFVLGSGHVQIALLQIPVNFVKGLLVLQLNLLGTVLRLFYIVADGTALVNRDVEAEADIFSETVPQLRAPTSVGRSKVRAVITRTDARIGR